MKTRTLRRTAALCLMAIMICAQAASADAVRITADRLNIRAGASTATKIVTTARSTDTLTYICEAGDWIMVSLNGKTGYVSKQYITIDESEIAADVASAQSAYTAAFTGTATERVNLRSLPKTDSSILKVVGKNASVTLTGECGEWYCVTYSGKSGYIAKQYIIKGEQQGSLPVLPTAAMPTPTPAPTSVPTMAPAPSTVPGVNESISTSISAKTTTRVNLRAATSTSSSILKVIPSGASVMITGETGSWYKVSYGDKVGFVSSRYIVKDSQNIIIEPAPTANVTPADTVYTESLSGKTTTRVNLREKADVSSKILAVLSKSAKLTVLGENGTWYNVTYGKKTGYVSKAYVTLSNPTPTAAPTQAPGNTGSFTAFTGVTDVEVNLRRAPEGEVLRVLKSGTEVSVIAKEGSWYKVQYLSTVGYIAASYVSEKNAVATPAPTAAPVPTTAPNNNVTTAGKDAWVVGGTVNVRKGAGTNYGVVTTVRTGKQITIYEEVNGFYRMTSGSTSGYISSKYVTTVDPGLTPSNPSVPSTPTVSTSNVINSDWWTGEVSKVYARGTVATVTDVDTGLSFKVKRTGGNNHADTQPLTAADTAIMYKIYNYNWAWTRRAIWVTVGDKTYAASMNGMPHGDSDSMPDNNFDGCFCIHFLNSRTHEGNRLDAAHQAAVKKAYETAMK